MNILHNHPHGEKILGLDDEVIVDGEFKSLFKNYRDNDSRLAPNHIIVSKEEYESIIN